MKHIRKTMMLVAVLLGVTAQAQAQQKADTALPYWYVQPTVGANIHLGEGSLGDRVSPAFSLSAGRQLTRLWGVRLSIDGWQSSNVVSKTDSEKYKWNYMQGTVDVTLSLTDLAGYTPLEQLGVYALAGGGCTLSWNNDEAKTLSASYQGFDKSWDGSRLFLAMKAGLGVSYQLSQCVALGLECTLSMLPDHFNSKVGKSSSRDSQLGILAGCKIAIGK